MKIKPSALYKRTPSTTSVTYKASDFEEISDVETWSDEEHKWVKVRINKPPEKDDGESPDDISDIELSDADTEFDWMPKKPSLSLEISLDSEPDTEPTRVPETPPHKQGRPLRKKVPGVSPIQKYRARRRTRRFLRDRQLMHSFRGLEKSVQTSERLHAEMADNMLLLSAQLERADEYIDDLQKRCGEILAENVRLKKSLAFGKRQTCAVKTRPEIWRQYK